MSFDSRHKRKGLQRKKAGLIGGLFVVTLLFALSIILSAGLPAHADPGAEFEERQVKAAFVYNFSKFVAWPEDAFESAEAPFVIGVVGDDPFGTILDETVRAKIVKEKGFAVNRFRSVYEIKPCHILFVSKSEEGRLAEILAHVKRWPVLTVSDIDAFCRRGGMITLVTEGSRVRFQINPDATEEVDLKLSSQLLKLAEIVRP